MIDQTVMVKKRSSGTLCCFREVARFLRISGHLESFNNTTFSLSVTMESFLKSLWIIQIVSAGECTS